MLNTVVQMDRDTILLPDGVSVYQITVSVTDKGELPHSNIFVYQIYDTLDTTRDTFQRVATPYDIENIPTTRNEAITAGVSFFLASVLYRKYSNLSQAVQAKDAIRSRVDNCINAWHTYKVSFEGTELINHPTAEASYEQQLADAYVDARDERVEAEEALVDAEQTLEDARNAVDRAVALSDVYRTWIDFTGQSYSIYWTDYYTAVQSVYTSLMAIFALFRADFLAITGQSYIATGSYGSYPHVSTSDGNTWLSNLQAMQAAAAAFNEESGNGASLQDSFGNFAVAANSGYATQQGVIATANRAVAQALTAKKEAEASLVAAQTAEDAALAAARAVCPDFDPTQV